MPERGKQYSTQEEKRGKITKRKKNTKKRKKSHTRKKSQKEKENYKQMTNTREKKITKREQFHNKEECIKKRNENCSTVEYPGKNRGKGLKIPKHNRKKQKTILIGKLNIQTEKEAALMVPRAEEVTDNVSTCVSN